jgi:hypothetical protein
VNYLVSQQGPIQGLDHLFEVDVGCHAHVAAALELPRLGIYNQMDRGNGAHHREKFPDILLMGIVGDMPHIQFFGHDNFPFCHPILRGSANRPHIWSQFLASMANNLSKVIVSWVQEFRGGGKKRF